MTTTCDHPAPCCGGEETIAVTLEGGPAIHCEAGTTPRRLADRCPPTPGLHHLGALVNHDTVSMSYPLEVDSHIRFLSVTDSHGWRIYRHTACFLLAKVIRELFPSARFWVEHSLGNGFFCNFEHDGRKDVQPDEVTAIEDKLRDLVQRDVPIRRMKIAFEDAVQQFKNEGQKDKYNLLRFQNPPKVIIYCCDGFSDLAMGPLADRSGALHLFKLIPYAPGFILQFPDREDPLRLPPFEDRPQLFHIFQEHKEWGRILGVQTVGQLNEVIAEGDIDDIIRVNEALHEKKLAEIADAVTRQRDRVQWILIAGPSSSGKTTFAKRLRVQMRVNGLHPVTLSVDDYFVNRDRTPRDEDGELDFEHVEALDLDLFNEHLQRLDRGDEIELPKFDFEQGKRVSTGRTMQIGPGEIGIIEGIHGLNPLLSQALPNERKFRIYISALTQLNLNHNHRIATTDNRLIRRLVRDHQFRGHSALNTLRMWPSVRRGEKRWVFPHQQHADVAFNSALEYELAVLKPLAEPLLAEVKPRDDAYAEARRLQEFLQGFLGISPDRISPNSILREFIGESAFRY